MNKTDLIKQLSKKLSVPQTECLRHFNALEEVFTSELEQKGSITLQGFGSFAPWKQTARPGRNPRSGAPCLIPQRMSVKFKPGKRLLEKLNA